MAKETNDSKAVQVLGWRERIDYNVGIAKGRIESMARAARRNCGLDSKLGLKFS